MEPLWELYDEGMNPRTRQYPLWALLGSREFMQALNERLPGLGLPWPTRSGSCGSSSPWPTRCWARPARARGVYHAHTTGYASLLGAAAARHNGTSFLLTEHNLYVRDTVNTLLDRNMALSMTERRLARRST